MKKNTLKTLAAAAVLGMAALQNSANSAVLAGDIAFIAGFADDAEAFAFVVLNPILGGDTINFTDSSYGNNVPGEETRFRFTEHLDAGGPIVWTAPLSGLGVGSVVVIREPTPSTLEASTGTVSGALMDLSASGDNLFAYSGNIVNLGGTTNYRGDASGVSFIGGFAWGTGSGFITSGPGSTSDSYLPSALTNGTTAWDIATTLDNIYYSGPTNFSSVAALLAALNDDANWSGSNSPLSTSVIPTFFIIPEPGTVAALAAGLLGVLALRRRK